MKQWVYLASDFQFLDHLQRKVWTLQKLHLWDCYIAYANWIFQIMPHLKPLKLYCVTSRILKTTNPNHTHISKMFAWIFFFLFWSCSYQCLILGHRYFSCLVVCQQVLSTAIWLHYEEHCGLSSGIEVVRALSFGGDCLLPLLHWRMALLALHRIRRFMWAVLKLKRIKETKISKKINLIQSRFSWTEAVLFRK